MHCVHFGTDLASKLTRKENQMITSKMWPNKLGVDLYKDGKRFHTIQCNPLSMQQMDFRSVHDATDWTKPYNTKEGNE